MPLGTLSETLRMLISRVRQPSSDISEIGPSELNRSILGNLQTAQPPFYSGRPLPP